METGLHGSLAAFGAAGVAIAAAYGIGKLAAASMEAIARQPEAAKNIQNAMILAAALIEGVAFFCAYICLKAVS